MTMRARAAQQSPGLEEKDTNNSEGAEDETSRHGVPLFNTMRHREAATARSGGVKENENECKQQNSEVYPEL